MGRCIVAGGKPDMAAPSAGILASDLAVGSIVKLMEGGVATEYLVVNQGKPSGSSLYDASCDGTWLLRKDIKENRQFNSTQNSDYANSTIHSYLNNDFFNMYSSVEKSAIKQVKIPYCSGLTGGAISSGSNGLLAYVFLLGAYEVGWNNSMQPYFPADGICLSYFNGASETDKKRISNLNGYASGWWLRSKVSADTTRTIFTEKTGGYSNAFSDSSLGIRPSVILKSTSKFDENTLALKGVA